jgi:hypothetical protein
MAHAQLELLSHQCLLHAASLEPLVAASGEATRTEAACTTSQGYVTKTGQLRGEMPPTPPFTTPRYCYWYTSKHRVSLTIALKRACAIRATCVCVCVGGGGRRACTMQAHGTLTRNGTCSQAQRFAHSTYFLHCPTRTPFAPTTALRTFNVLPSLPHPYAVRTHHSASHIQRTSFIAPPVRRSHPPHVSSRVSSVRFSTTIYFTTRCVAHADSHPLSLYLYVLSASLDCD